MTSPGITVSLPNPIDSDTDRLNKSPAAALTPEDERNVDLLLRNIHNLRTHPLPKNPDEARDMNRQRNLRIIEIATDIARLCEDDETRQVPFQSAIAERLESRLQLAVSGNAEDVDQLYADVRTLNETTPSSESAAEGVYTLARFAHAMARQNGQDDLRWYENFSRWSREFADRFPEQQRRAIPLLMGAAQSCELHAITLSSSEENRRLFTEAKLCYTNLTENFPDAKEAAESAAALRRRALPGKKLEQFGGPILDGSFINAEDFVGTVTVIFFWESGSAEFRQELLPLLLKAKEAAGDRLRFVSVNLDTEQTVLQTFLAANSVPGQIIFHSNPNQRGWDSPLVRFWGVTRSPSVWLLDSRGIVSDVDVGHRQLAQKMRQLFERPGK